MSVGTFFLSIIRGMAHWKFMQGKGIRSNPFINFFIDLAFRIILPKNIKTAEVQGSLMVMDLENKKPSIRRTYQMYYMQRIHEEVTTEIFKRMVRKGDRVLDVGANIGYFSLLAARLVGPKGEVNSFEPEPKNFKYLTDNIKLNKYKNVHPHNVAVSDKKGKLQLTECDVDSGHHSINRDGKDVGRQIEVDTLVMDDLFAAKHKAVNLVKMDVEGSEPYVINGMKKTIKQSKDIKIIMEFYPKMIRKAGFDPEKFLKSFFGDLKLNLYVIADDYMALSKKNLKVSNPAQVMEMCKAKNAHVNLFLEKGNTFEKEFPVVKA